MADFLFVLLIIFIVFGVFRRYILFFLMSALSKRLFNEMNRMQQRQNGYRQQQQTPPGRVQVDPSVSGKKPIRDVPGEYVDFEEVKE